MGDEKFCAECARLRKNLWLARQCIIALENQIAAGNFNSDCQENSYNALHDAAKELVLKIKAIHANEAYKGVWVLAANHGNPYAGPTYDQELKALAEEVGLADSGL